MQKAVLEQTKKETFQGYGPYEGFEFLRKAIAEHDFAPYGVSIGLDEIFISDGAKSDVGSVCDLFSANNVIDVYKRQVHPAANHRLLPGSIILPCLLYTSRCV